MSDDSDTSSESIAFVYSSRASLDNIPTPLSPASSVKACFVRSRPTSPDCLDYEYSDLTSLGGLVAAQFSSSSDVSENDESISGATEKRADAPTNNHAAADARSIFAPSTYSTASRSTVVPVRIVRRPETVLYTGVNNLSETINQDAGEMEGWKLSTRRRTWPSYKAIRQTVSSILHRNHIAPTTAKGPDCKPVEPIKPFSASPFTKSRQSTVSVKMSRPSFAKRTLSSRSRDAKKKALQHRAELRRSRSFSGFTNVLSAIEDEGEDLDEVTAEARGVVEAIRRRWVFETVPEDNQSASVNVGLFERCVE